MAIGDDLSDFMRSKYVKLFFYGLLLVIICMAQRYVINPPPKAPIPLESFHLVPLFSEKVDNGRIIMSRHVEVINSIVDAPVLMTYLHAQEIPIMLLRNRELFQSEKAFAYGFPTFNQNNLTKLLDLTPPYRGEVKIYFVNDLSNKFEAGKSVIVGSERTAIIKFKIHQDIMELVDDVTDEIYKVINDVFLKVDDLTALMEDVKNTKKIPIVQMSYDLLFIIVAENSTKSAKIKNSIKDFLGPFNSSIEYTNMTYNYTTISIPIDGTFTPKGIMRYLKPYLNENVNKKYDLTWIITVNSAGYINVSRNISGATFDKKIAFYSVDESDLINDTIATKIMWQYHNKLKRAMGFNSTLPSYVQYIRGANYNNTSKLDAWELDTWLYKKELACIMTYMMKKLPLLSEYKSKLNCLDNYAYILKTTDKEESAEQLLKKHYVFAPGFPDLVEFLKIVEASEWLAAKAKEADAAMRTCTEEPCFIPIQFWLTWNVYTPFDLGVCDNPHMYHRRITYDNKLKERQAFMDRLKECDGGQCKVPLVFRNAYECNKGEKDYHDEITNKRLKVEQEIEMKKKRKEHQEGVDNTLIVMHIAFCLGCIFWALIPVDTTYGRTVRWAKAFFPPKKQPSPSKRPSRSDSYSSSGSTRGYYYKQDNSNLGKKNIPLKEPRRLGSYSSGPSTIESIHYKQDTSNLEKENVRMRQPMKFGSFVSKQPIGSTFYKMYNMGESRSRYPAKEHPVNPNIGSTFRFKIGGNVIEMGNPWLRQPTIFTVYTPDLLSSMHSKRCWPRGSNNGSNLSDKYCPKGSYSDPNLSGRYCPRRSYSCPNLSMGGSYSSPNQWGRYCPKGSYSCPNISERYCPRGSYSCPNLPGYC